MKANQTPSGKRAAHMERLLKPRGNEGKSKSRDEPLDMKWLLAMERAHGQYERSRLISLGEASVQR